MSNLNKVIVALDQMSLEEIDLFLRRSENTLTFVKIGLELFLKHGPEIVLRIKRDHNKKIFLDLKLHDIPNTVGKAIHSLKGLPIDFLTLHLTGGEEMLKEAVIARNESIPGCKLLGVSFLTSLEAQDLESLFAITNSEAAFLRLFNLASRSGIDGVVSSPHEVVLLKNHYPKLLSVTPGIRFQDEINSTQTQDQKRVMDPKEAFNVGADFLVMGRSLTKAHDLKNRIQILMS
ncbi:MAG: orotidine-5'-phosphate decarboxylase [Bdellovibrionales bacterium]|nr:orotidine-5'-phosphate decarboxylase [Bdellovibrionales bacterium]